MVCCTTDTCMLRARRNRRQSRCDATLCCTLHRARCMHARASTRSAHACTIDAHRGPKGGDSVGNARGLHWLAAMALMRAAYAIGPRDVRAAVTAVALLFGGTNYWQHYCACSSSESFCLSAIRCDTSSAILVRSSCSCSIPLMSSAVRHSSVRREAMNAEFIQWPRLSRPK